MVKAAVELIAFEGTKFELFRTEGKTYQWIISGIEENPDVCIIERNGKAHSEIHVTFNRDTNRMEGKRVVGLYTLAALPIYIRMRARDYFLPKPLRKPRVLYTTIPLLFAAPFDPMEIKAGSIIRDAGVPYVVHHIERIDVEQDGFIVYVYAGTVNKE